MVSARVSPLFLPTSGGLMSRNVSWVRIEEHPFRIECDRCGSVDRFKFPENVVKLRRRLTEFVNRHRECEEPVAS
jgi:hypothetical protein